ncbi:hypothetical protein M2281_005068 [Mesorhizobium soli]|nr:hypothetical protein [Mesorhizobium soli]
MAAFASSARGRLPGAGQRVWCSSLQPNFGGKFFLPEDLKDGLKKLFHKSEPLAQGLAPTDNADRKRLLTLLPQLRSYLDPLFQRE